MQDALAQLPFVYGRTGVGRQVLIRTDGGGGTQKFLTWLTRQRLSYSVGFTLTADIVQKLELLPDAAWTPAINSDRSPRDGAWVADVTGVLQLSKDWPKRMRVIVRAE